MNNVELASINDLASMNQLLESEKLPQIEANFFSNYFIIKSENRIIACIGLEEYGKFGLLRSLVVDKNYRNTGIANQLVSEIEKLADQKQMREIYLLTTTAEKYFQRKGFKTINRTAVPDEIKRSKEFSDICPASSAVMKKGLN